MQGFFRGCLGFHSRFIRRGFGLEGWGWGVGRIFGFHIGFQVEVAKNGAPPFGVYVIFNVLIGFLELSFALVILPPLRRFVG
jgi:hypothetical protein